MQRAQRPRRGQRIAPPPQHARPLTEPGDKPGDHRGLADPGLPAQQHHPPAPARGCPSAPIQLGQHRLALQQPVHQGHRLPLGSVAPGTVGSAPARFGANIR